MSADKTLLAENVYCPHCGNAFMPAKGISQPSKQLADKKVICPCDLCHKPIGFDPEKIAEGSTVTCPHCAGDTVLYIPQIPNPALETGQGADSQPSGAAIVTTSNSVEGYRIVRYLGLVRGIVVRSPKLDQQLFGRLNTIVGGNIESYAKVCEFARREALSRMLANAKNLSADAVIGFRYDATEFGPGITEVLAYGTAVQLEQSHSP
jgi:uncharacterized protein YbjQ (UPF0145 family)